MRCVFNILLFETWFRSIYFRSGASYRFKTWFEEFKLKTVHWMSPQGNKCQCLATTYLFSIAKKYFNNCITYTVHLLELCEQIIHVFLLEILEVSTLTNIFWCRPAYSIKDSWVVIMCQLVWKYINQKLWMFCCEINFQYYEFSNILFKYKIMKRPKVNKKPNNMICRFDFTTVNLK